MVLFYTIGWKLGRVYGKRKNGNFIKIIITCLDENGRQHQFEKMYEEWIGVCTDNADRVVQNIHKFFPNCDVRFQRLGESLHAKVLPYFEERLLTGKLDYSKKPFYKFYTSACIEDLGRFLDMYKYAYYEKNNWAVRVYLDLCTRYKTEAGFYYKWYDVNVNEPLLVDSFRMLPELNKPPNWTIAAFDLETVCLSGEDRVPTGMDPADRIVMISIVKWDATNVKKYVLYLDPRPNSRENISGLNEHCYIKYHLEEKMIHDFHGLIQDCQVLTGYNIDKFDIPCLFARMVWLGMRNIYDRYSSQMVGDHLVTTFQNITVIDAYPYFHTFSNYDLNGFKLDNVAQIKLKRKEGKVPIDSRGIQAWYINSAAVDLLDSTDRNLCHEILKPPRYVTVDRFGTFRDYLEYAMRDAELVHDLFKKETILHFLLARANFGVMGVVKALHYGNSKVLLEVFKTYGTLLGFFINVNYFQNMTDGSKFESVYVNGTYQGALNWCRKSEHFENVSVLDFVSMYPAALRNGNVDYGTATILTAEEYLKIPHENLTCIPYRVHHDSDFTHSGDYGKKQFQYPAFDPLVDRFVIVLNQRIRAFLPSLVGHFVKQRKNHQCKFKETRDVMHHNVQLCIKIMINSLYGIMASQNSPLAKLPLAMIIVTLSRYQLLGSYDFVNRLGFTVCYADTDSLMVQKWPVDHCEEINRYLNLEHVEIKFEQRMNQLLVLSKKRYIYETYDGKLHTKGFQKRVDGLIQFMSDKLIRAVMGLHGQKGSMSDGWILWVETLQEVSYMCRDPKKYSITRKTKKLDEYKSKSCAAVKMLTKYPEKENEYIDYTYSRADVAAKEASDWIMDVRDCKYVDLVKLITSQKRIFCDLLNWGYWMYSDPHERCSMVLNTIRWKYFVHAELKHKLSTGRNLVLMVERGVKYTFHINDLHRLKRVSHLS